MVNGNPQGNMARSLTRDPEKGIWFSMQYNTSGESENVEPGGGLVYFDGEEQFKRYCPTIHDFIDVVEYGPGRDPSADEIHNTGFTSVSGVAFDKNGDLWVGTKNNGLYSIPSEKLPDPSTDSDTSGPTQTKSRSPTKAFWHIQPLPGRVIILPWNSEAKGLRNLKYYYTTFRAGL